MRRKSEEGCKLRLRTHADMQNILMAPLRRVVYAFLERALEVRHGLSAASESQRRAQIVSPSLT